MYTILHVEASKFYKSLINNICVELKMEYKNATKIADAFDILKKAEINLIITTMEIKGGTAEEFVAELNKTDFKNIPIVVVTGNDSYEVRQKMYDLGIVDYISKQADPDEIKHSIQTYINDDEIIYKLAKLKYAVCDDSSMDRFIIERIFTMYNIKNVDYYESGYDLLKSEKEYDVYIVDLVLEKISGRNVITQIRSRKKDNVIISISGMDNPKVISNVLTAGADDYITKPFNNEIFMSRLKTNVRNYLLLKQLETKNILLGKMAITDGLTGLYNHKYIVEELKNEISIAKRYKKELSLVMFDIDHFKKINDSYGHQFGDEVIMKVAKVIKDTVRESDIPARYGGEEFIIILPETDMDSAIKLADRIRINIEKMNTTEINCNVTISAGVKQMKNEKLNDLIKATDDLLYEAKKNGRNRVES